MRLNGGACERVVIPMGERILVIQEIPDQQGFVRAVWNGAEVAIRLQDLHERAILCEANARPAKMPRRTEPAGGSQSAGN